LRRRYFPSDFSIAARLSSWCANSAWFEVFLEGRWYTFDARHNQPRIGRIVIARGRDAADVAISTTFGSAALSRFTVVTEEVVEESRQLQPAK
jgi:transglutaminase-like putative cysteine protease